MTVSTEATIPGLKSSVGIAVVVVEMQAKSAKTLEIIFIINIKFHLISTALIVVVAQPPVF